MHSFLNQLSYDRLGGMSENSQREALRLQAWELKQQGWRQSEIATKLGVTPSAVSQWVKRATEKGSSALRQQPRGGRPCRLSGEEIDSLLILLEFGATAWGFSSDEWTNRRIAIVISQEFGVYYHPAHISRL